MREAYPGAVYYYMTMPYRVMRIISREKKIIVRREKHYTTDPYTLPTRVSPQLTEGSIHQAVQLGDLKLVECDMYVSEAVVGYTEKRGGTKLPTVKYPCEFWNFGRYSRNFSTTGVMIFHPLLSQPGNQPKLLADLLLAAFLMVAPFERTEVSSSIGKCSEIQLNLFNGNLFLVIYDQTYGSLRLTGRFMEEETLQAVFTGAQEIVEGERLEFEEPLNTTTLQVLGQMASETRQPVKPLNLQSSPQFVGSGEGELVIMPGSTGWIVADNQEFLVERVFFRPSEGLSYQGKRVGQVLLNNLRIYFPVANVRPIPGLSLLGRYNYDTGEIEPLGTVDSVE